MSSDSLRRQIFQRNIDLLLQNGSLDTVEEENGRQQDGLNETTIITLSEEDMPDDSLLHKSPVYKTSKLSASPTGGAPSELPSETVNHQHNKKGKPCNLYLKNQRLTVSDCYGTDEQPGTPFVHINIDRSQPDGCPGTPYFAPWDRKAGPPSTPYTEIDDSVTRVKKRIMPEPLHVNNTPKGDKSCCKRDSLPFSPINGRPIQSLKSLFKGGTACRTCSQKDEVRSLPMSPVLLVSQTTSTPGPAGISMDSPHCKTLLENMNSIFSFNECNMCRICHEDGSDERLVSPCHCAGTMGMLHISCLEQWLGSSNTTKCEICQFQFVVQKKPRSFKWYMQEPSLKEDKRLMVRDILLTVAISCLVMLVTVLCLWFTKQLMLEDQPGPSTVLILLAILALLIFCVWLLVAGRRMILRMRAWHEEHHIVQIKQKKTDGGETSNQVFRRFPVRLSSKHKNRSPRKAGVDNNLLSSTYIGYSLESYKAAMFNPVLPSEPLLEDDNNNEITSLCENSSSVLSLDRLLEECVNYYQPPKCGTTSVLLDESGKSLKETGV